MSGLATISPAYLLPLDLLKRDGKLRQKHAHRHVRIWSGSCGAWWRAKAQGYTTSDIEAGEWSFSDAYAYVKSLGAEKGIILHILPDLGADGSTRRRRLENEADAIDGELFRLIGRLKELAEVYRDDVLREATEHVLKARIGVRRRMSAAAQEATPGEP